MLLTATKGDLAVGDTSVGLGPMIVIGRPFMQCGIYFFRFCRKPEGQFFIVENDFEEDIFDSTGIVIFQRNPSCAVLSKEFLNLCNCSFDWYVSV